MFAMSENKGGAVRTQKKTEPNQGSHKFVSWTKYLGLREALVAHLTSPQFLKVMSASECTRTEGESFWTGVTRSALVSERGYW